MNSTDIQEQMQGVFRKVFDNASITISENTTAEDIRGWDSLTHMHLLSEIEQHFRITFSFNEVSNFNKVGDIITCVRGKL